MVVSMPDQASMNGECKVGILGIVLNKTVND